MKKGYITVYFALIFMVLISFVLSVFEGLKIYSAKLKVECAFSVASSSVLGEYHKDLLEMFDLFYVDTSYQTKQPNYHYIEAHLWDYLKENTDTEILSVELQGITMATDNNGVAFRKQISDYMKDKVGISYIEKLTETYQVVKETGYMEDGGEEILESKADEISEEIPDETWKAVELYYPLEDMKQSKNSFVLSQVLTNDKEISTKQILPQNYISERECIVGTGEDKELDFTDKVLFIQYVFEKFFSYSDNATENDLDYEVEYLIGGKNNDYDNLSVVVKKLLVLREIFNAAYLVTDTEKMSLIQDFSLLVATLVCCPEIEPVITASIVGVWSYQESIADVKTLLQEGKVPLTKSKDSWITDLDSVFTMNFSEKSPVESNPGMTYQDYLKLLMLFADNTQLTYRSMDLIEMHIRKIESNEAFRMDGCAEDFSVNIIFDISMFGSYQIVRKFGYFS